MEDKKKKPEEAGAENPDTGAEGKPEEGTAAEQEGGKDGAPPKPQDNGTDGSQPDDNGADKKPGEDGADKKPKEGGAENPAPAAEAERKPAEEGETQLTEQQDLAAELLSAKVQLAAYKTGVRADCVEDAVILAMYGAKKNGAVTEETVTEALSDVLNRHSEWNGFEEPKQNFRVGADGMQKAGASTDEISKIFGN